jgi:3-methyladenine DNA glycosylase/8-oxoguanine DNA glycosylase
MAEAREEELTELGFSRRKAEYVLGVARAELSSRRYVIFPTTR